MVLQRKEVHLLGHNNSPNRGRPSIGLQAKDAIVKTRLDAYTMQRLEHASRILDMPKAELLRQGLLLYLDHMSKTIPELSLK